MDIQMRGAAGALTGDAVTAGTMAVESPSSRAADSGTVFSDLWRYLRSAGTGLVGSVAGSAVSGAISGGLGGLGADYASLLEMQRQMQAEMLTVTMLTNVERSKHEGKISIARNIRVG